MFSLKSTDFSHSHGPAKTDDCTHLPDPPRQLAISLYICIILCKGYSTYSIGVFHSSCTVHTAVYELLCHFLRPVALAKRYKLVITHFLWPLAKYNHSTLALPRPHIVFCLQPWAVGYDYYLSSVSCMTKDTFASFFQQSTPELFFSLCISSLLKGAARNKSITNVQLAHNEEQVEEVLTHLLADFSVEERGRIGRGQCTLESGQVCSCIEVPSISE